MIPTKNRTSTEQLHSTLSTSGQNHKQKLNQTKWHSMTNCVGLESRLFYRRIVVCCVDILGNNTQHQRAQCWSSWEGLLTSTPHHSLLCWTALVLCCWLNNNNNNHWKGHHNNWLLFLTPADDNDKMQSTILCPGPLHLHSSENCMTSHIFL